MKPSLFPASLQQLLSQAVLFSGLMLALLLWLAPKPDKTANRFLSFALAVGVLNVAGFPSAQLLALGPLLYLYVRKLTISNTLLSWKDVLHFLPLLASYWLSQPVAMFSVVIYLFLSHRLIQRFYNRVQPVLMDRPRFAFRKLNRVLWLLGILCLLTLLSQGFFLALALVLIIMAADVLLKPGPALAITASKTDEREKARRLKEAVAAGHLYKDPELTLDSLGAKLGIHPHDLSRIVNAGLKKNFNDFINDFRVREVVRKMKDPDYDHITLLGISYESGFNSQRTFNRVFKELTGKTPVGYKNSLIKKLPNDNLANAAQIRPLILHSKRKFMFRNYLKIAWRNTLYNKAYSTLNIAGLATGMAVALLIGLWAYNQYSYDRFLPGYQQAYSVKVNYTNPASGTSTQDLVSLPLADVLRNTVPGIRYVAETSADFAYHDFVAGDKKLLVSGGTVAPDFLKIFRYPLVKGDISQVLKEANSVVLDQSTAKALFGNEDPVNKMIRVDNQQVVKVTGVMNDFPANSSMKFQFLMPFAFAEQTANYIRNSRTQWTNNSFGIYVGLQPGVTSAQIGPKIKDLIARYYPADRAYKPELFLYPLKDWHLRSDFKDGRAAGGLIGYVRMFSIIGALVLLIACINFVNLSTARSEKRAREVGIRKTIGSTRYGLIFQFITESMLITFTAFLLSIGLVQLSIPYFNALTNGSVQIPYGEPLFWCIMIVYVVSIGLLAGARPAFYLSAFKPVKVLKGRIETGKRATLPRKVLVVLQFTCSVAFIISTVIIYRQIQYAKDRPMGFKVNGLVETFMTADLANHYDALRNDLLRSGMVEQVTKSSSPVTDVGWHTGIAGWPGQRPGELTINVGAVIVNDQYFKTVGMPLTGGQNFSSELKADSANVIVNEAAVKRMGLEEPVNQMITFNGIKGKSRIIGVVKDALMESPFKPIEPTVFVHTKGWCSRVIYRLSANADPHMAITKIGGIFDSYNPAYPFTYQFVDEAYDHKFNLETLVGKLAGIFAGLAIFVSCLGLFGLAAYVAEQRTKEIGIRKVLGASVAQVWLLLTKDFVLLVVISCALASPIALYFLSGWLQQYDYRVPIGTSVFLLSAAAAIMITLITISFQAIKAALAKPVKSLRSE